MPVLEMLLWATGFATTGSAASSRPSDGALMPCQSLHAPVQEPCSVPVALSAEAAKALLGDRKLAWSRNGDRLTVLGFAGQQGDVMLCCALKATMRPIGSDGIVGVTLRVPRIDHAIIDVLLVKASSLDGPKLFRGTYAPPAPRAVSQLQGSLDEITLQSRHLNEPRKLTVYRPAVTQRAKLPTIYLADGEITRNYAAILEAAIDSGRAQPAIIVGLHSARGQVDACGETFCDRRNLDYLPARGNRYPGGADFFSRHLAFVEQEVIPLIERQYGARKHRRARIAAGFSSGAAWAFAAASLRPGTFGGVLGLSPGSMASAHLASSLTHARVYTGAGLFEPNFLAATRRRAELARRAGATVYYRELVSGHSQAMWDVLFEDGISKLLPVSGRGSGSTD